MLVDITSTSMLGKKNHPGGRENDLGWFFALQFALVPVSVENYVHNYVDSKRGPISLFWLSRTFIKNKKDSGLYALVELFSKGHKDCFDNAIETVLGEKIRLTLFASGSRIDVTSKREGNRSGARGVMKNSLLLAL